MELLYTRVETTRQSDKVKDKNFTFNFFFNVSNGVPCSF